MEEPLIFSYAANCKENHKKINPEDFPKNKKELLERKEKIKSDKNINKKFELKDKSINTQINRLAKWDKGRQEKIQKKRQQSIESERNQMNGMFRPRLDKNSQNIVRKRLNNSTDNAFERLYKDYVNNRKERDVMFKKINEPTFKPSLARKGIRIQTRNYDDKDGKKVYVTEVIADFCELFL